MSTNDTMKLADIFWKLDALADSNVLSAEATTAARDAARSLREVTRSLGIDPAQGADSINVAIEALKERFRQAQQQAGSN